MEAKYESVNILFGDHIVFVELNLLVKLLTETQTTIRNKQNVNSEQHGDILSRDAHGSDKIRLRSPLVMHDRTQPC